MLYVSHLIPDEDMASLLGRYWLGVESIEFSIGYCLDEWRVRAEAYRERLFAMGWGGMLSVHGPFLDLNPVSWDSKVAKVSRERYSQAYEAAYELGAGRIIYHTCFVPMINYLDGWAERMIAFWDSFMRDKGMEITVCLENVFDPVYEPLLEIARAGVHPAFGLCLDVGHAHWASSQSVEEWLEKLSPYICHLHLHDNHGNHDEHLGLGRGNLSWDTILAFIRENLSHAGITVENPDRKDCERSISMLEDNKLAIRR